MAENTMNEPDVGGTLTPGALLQSVTRTLRHEVGDLLQTVYSTVAILQERVPADAQLERRFLADLRVRAEMCRDELDAVHDLVLPISLKKDPFDLTELAGGLASTFAARHKSLEVRLEADGPMPIDADVARLRQVGRLLMAGACQSARRSVVVCLRYRSDADEVEWSIQDDGHGAAPEQLQWLVTPFATTHQALWGLGLALAKKVAELHDGKVTADNRPDEGFRVTLWLPNRAQVRGRDASKH
jgi:two-component system OmpR family sensor kinase